MEDYPKTLPDFEKRFSTEEACRKYLFNLRWPEGFQCPQCGYGKAWPIKRYFLCECTHCGFQVYIMAGTIFQDTKKPLRLWFRAIWYITSQKYETNALGIQRALGLGSYHTAWTWLHKLRRAMVRPGRDRLSGTVQIDEIYIGREKPGKRGRGAAGKTLVVIMVELKEGKTARIRLGHVADASGPSLVGAVEGSVEAGSTVQTDGWEGYSRLSELGYRHEIIRKKAVIGRNVLPKVNRIAQALAARNLPRSSGVFSSRLLS